MQYELFVGGPVTGEKNTGETEMETLKGESCRTALSLLDA